VITLHTFPGVAGLESMSPFCMKVEVYLKLQKLAYRTQMGSPRAAPKGKFPFIEREDGTKIADSSAILEALERDHPEPLDRGLGDFDRARSRILQRTMEEALYFNVLWSRWADDRGWAEVKKVFSFLPAPVRPVVSAFVRRSVVKTAHAQGTGRHSPEEIYLAAERDLEAISKWLGDAPYFADEKLRTIDVTAYAFLANVERFPTDTPVRAAIRRLPNLVKFIDRMSARVSEAES
jgi:glutathione S-transferase